MVQNISLILYSLSQLEFTGHRSFKSHSCILIPIHHHCGENATRWQENLHLKQNLQPPLFSSKRKKLKAVSFVFRILSMPSEDLTLPDSKPFSALLQYQGGREGFEPLAVSFWHQPFLSSKFYSGWLLWWYLKSWTLSITCSSINWNGTESHCQLKQSYLTSLPQNLSSVKWRIGLWEL